MKKYIAPEINFNAVECEDIMNASIERTEYKSGSGTGNSALDIGDFLDI